MDTANYYNHVGCYTSDCIQHNYNVSDHNQTPAKCASFCHRGGYYFAGIQNSTLCSCMCRHTCWNQLNDGECGLPCPGETSQFCGGIGTADLYELGPRSVSAKACDSVPIPVTIVTNIDETIGYGIHPVVYLIIGIVIGLILSGLGNVLWKKLKRRNMMLDLGNADAGKITGVGAIGLSRRSLRETSAGPRVNMVCRSETTRSSRSRRVPTQVAEVSAQNCSKSNDEIADEKSAPEVQEQYDDIADVKPSIYNLNKDSDNTIRRKVQSMGAGNTPYTRRTHSVRSPPKRSTSNASRMAPPTQPICNNPYEATYYDDTAEQSPDVYLNDSMVFDHTTNDRKWRRSDSKKGSGRDDPQANLPKRSKSCASRVHPHTVTAPSQMDEPPYYDDTEDQTQAIYSKYGGSTFPSHSVTMAKLAPDNDEDTLYDPVGQTPTAHLKELKETLKISLGASDDRGRGADPCYTKVKSSNSTSTDAQGYLYPDNVFPHYDTIEES